MSLNIPETDIKRYFTYSFLIHLFLLGWIAFNNFSSQKTKVYYAVDFIAGLPGGGSGGQTAAKKMDDHESIKTKIVNPQEDLLLKSKKKPSKKEKEVISTVPEVPSVPSPKVLGKSE